MKAIVLTYSTNGLNSNEVSKISKKLHGYIDKSNRSLYIYKRKGILQNIEHIRVDKKTYIIPEDDYKTLAKTLRDMGTKVRSWKIDVEKI